MTDSDTSCLELIKNLARVGKAVTDTFSEENLDMGSDFYLALDSINNFKEGYEKLELDEETHAGLNNLVDYLRKKVERRLGYTGAKNVDIYA